MTEPTIKTRYKRGQHPNSLKSLKHFEVGNHASPGRPRNPFCVVARQTQMLQEKCPFDAQGRTWLEALAEAGLRMSLQKPEAFRDLLDRHAGKVTLPIGGDEESPIFISLLSKLRGNGAK